MRPRPRKRGASIWRRARSATTRISTFPIPRFSAPRACCARARGYCVGKAALYAALCRAGGLPARVGFADVTNHLSSEKLREKMGTNYFAWHGFTEVKLGDRWVKASPTFNSTLCDRFGVRALDFDGGCDALLQAYDGEGRTFMRYEVMHGAFHDVPAKFLIAEMARRYPSLKRPARPLGGRHGERGSPRNAPDPPVTLALDIVRATNRGASRARGSIRRGDVQGGPHRQDRNRTDRKTR